MINMSNKTVKLSNILKFIEERELASEEVINDLDGDKTNPIYEQEIAILDTLDLVRQFVISED